MPSFFSKLLLLVTGALGLGAMSAGKKRRADPVAKQGKPADNAHPETRIAGRPSDAHADPSAAPSPLKPKDGDQGFRPPAAREGGAPGPVEPVAPAEPLAKELDASAADAVKQPGTSGATDVSTDTSPALAAEPRRLDGPRNGTPDNLTRIKGIGPAIERLLFEHGIYHFDQIAGWSAAESRWIDQMVGFAGRVGREGWIEQAREFARD